MKITFYFIGGTVAGLLFKASKTWTRLLIWAGAMAAVLVIMAGCATGLPGSGDTKLRDYQVPIQFTVEAGATHVTQ